jgi:very-short-patch-repair endonuclease
VIGAYVVDFYCARAGLVVEVDGVTHVGREAKDAERTRHLARCDLKVLRVTDDDVLKNVDGVMASIAVAAGLDV